MNGLKITNVSKTFGKTNVLKDINVEIADGKFLILVGPSGCGKSTLLNIIAGLETATTGSIEIAGEDVISRDPKDRNIAMVFQSYALYPTMTVRGNIAFGLNIRKVPKAEQQQIVDRVAKMLRIEDLLDRKPAQLSGGQRQRVAMGRALARDPAIFLFDEPLSNLDAKLRVDMRTEIKELHQRMKTTVVYVTHDQVEAMTLGDYIAVMKDGIIQQFGTPSEIYNHPNNMFVAGFMGSPSMNFIPCQLTEVGGDVGVYLQGHTTRFFVRLSQTGKDYSRWLGKNVMFGIRPEHITDYAEQVGVQEALPCKVDILEPTGPDTLLFITLNKVKVVCRVTPETAVQHSIDKMPLYFNTAKAVLFDPASGLAI
ncbi:ABC transporter ATP-binding protein [Thiothrix subterranea]|uniref:Sn-glycerol-3-phosphate ABC transporter ATP-binding protein UgpC n=1 Tax=Thiothrix subterranea TaxID=2735563 RepID=A0AA51MJM8_9GAMM|nr:sn-glycerol-3-phosphate ABC transporter ATP-binding protein UgpC [Thiothrix subterranea]MDQ5767636.1 sn-glycerol-3-phosphate ABC transporter ATP-binding protein UgpC [Thiothrix subterranea]WML85443.1 sn-glycerol-3-phosphate ABC transporter ATP-binding protein UgpC [Thiothrix subterranea]